MSRPGDERYSQEQNCVKCGSCTAVCPVYRASGGKEFYSARGRQHLRKLGLEEDALVTRDVFFNCLLCGACKKVCPKDIDTPAQVRAVRANQTFFPGGYKKFLVQKIGQNPELLQLFQQMGKAVERLGGGRIPPDSGLNIRLSMLNTQEGDGRLKGDNSPNQSPPEKRELVQQSSLQPLLFFPGCVTSHIAPKVMAAHQRLLAHYGFSLQVPENLVCCGTASLSLGDYDGAARFAKQNIEAFEETSGPILVSCASCYARLSCLEKAFLPSSPWLSRASALSKRFIDLSLLLSGVSLLAEDDFAEKVQKTKIFYHDPCHARHSHDVTEEPRTLLRKRGDFELVELVDGPQCCGLGGLFHVEAPQISAEIRDDLAHKVFALEPDIITTTCSGCLMQWRAIVAQYSKTIKVLHLTETLCL